MWGHPLHAGNFHRKILSVPGFVESTGATTARGGPRGGPRARLYRPGTRCCCIPRCCARLGSNPSNAWLGRFRFGHFDALAHAYALAVAGGVDGLALTHLDVASDRLRLCWAYDWTDRLEPGSAGDLARQERLTRRLMSTRPVYDAAPRDWVGAVEESLAVPVVLTSHGPTATDKRPRR